jgi:hypothetical protein
VRFPKRLLVSLTVALVLQVAVAQGQPAQAGSQPVSPPGGGPPVVSFSDGGAAISGAGPMESIYISPKAGAPFSMKLGAEWSRPMAGGGSFTLANERGIARDSKGRIYQERWILVPKGGDIKSEMNVFQLTDPEQHTWYSCWTRKKVCELNRYADHTGTVYQPRLRQSGPLPDGRGYVQTEDLGVGTIQGLETHGYRETTTLNPGTMGNDREMVAMREFWFSTRLGINLSSIVDNPQTGKQVFTVKELTTSEPDPSLFEVPADYRVVDNREDPEKPLIKPGRP